MPDLRYSFGISVSLLIIFLITRQKFSENRLFDVPQTKWYIMLTLIPVLLYFSAVWPVMHKIYLIDHIKLMVIVFIAYKVMDNPAKFERFVWCYLIGIFYVGYVAFSTGRTGAGRLEGIGMVDGADSNGTAAVLITAVPLCLFYMMRSEKLWKKGLAAAILAFTLNAIILINSRGSFLGLVAGNSFMFYFMFFSKNVKGSQKLKLLGLLFVGVCLFVYLTDAAFWERMYTLKKVSEGGGGSGRTFFWLKTIEVVKDYPFGAGIRGYTYLSPKFIPEELLTGGVRAVHSTVFQVWAEYGHLGLISYIGYVVSNFNLSRKVRKNLLNDNPYLFYQSIAIDSGFISFLVAVSFIDKLHSVTLYWYPLFIACFANIYYLKKNKSVNENSMEEK